MALIHYADGTESFRVLRFEQDGDKTYRPIHPAPEGWREGDPPGELPLYGLADLNEAERVYIVEGEKCVEMAGTIGLTATTPAHGANSASKTDWSPLAGRECVILPDNNEVGKVYADSAGSILTHLSPPAKVKVVKLPQLGPGEDIIDYIERRDSVESDGLRIAIEALAEEATLVSLLKSETRNEKSD